MLYFRTVVEINDDANDAAPTLVGVYGATAPDATVVDVSAIDVDVTDTDVDVSASDVNATINTTITAGGGSDEVEPEDFSSVDTFFDSKITAVPWGDLGTAVGPFGMHNFGRSCFVNAGIQVLLHTKYIPECLLMSSSSTTTSSPEVKTALMQLCSQILALSRCPTGALRTYVTTLENTFTRMKLTRFISSDAVELLVAAVENIICDDETAVYAKVLRCLLTNKIDFRSHGTDCQSVSASYSTLSENMVVILPIINKPRNRDVSESCFIFWRLWLLFLF